LFPLWIFWGLFDAPIFKGLIRLWILFWKFNGPVLKKKGWANPRFLLCWFVGSIWNGLARSANRFGGTHLLHLHMVPILQAMVHGGQSLKSPKGF
jgi:hypothetical protein